MCGVTGAVRPGGLPRATLEAMCDVIAHRGPDSAGFHQRGNVALAVRRLRVIDLVTGDQPIVSLCSGATIVYNGELYNYRELRADLEGRGHRFTTQSDTEVALHFYEEYGPERFGHLNGIFAFAIDDPRADRVVLARDQLGVKPLYVARPSAAEVIFASEPKAILRSGLVKRDVDPVAVENYLTFGHSVGDRTMWRSIRKLPAAHVMVIERGTVTVTRYWDALARARHWAADAPPPIEEMAELLGDAVRGNMIADVPVGAFLSGGIDSSLVTALMRRDNERLHTYSVGFGTATDELPDALRVAAYLGTMHEAITVTPVDAADAIDDIVRIYDEPFADAAAIPTYLMSKRARQDVTVVLTGEGGDEVFGGYRRYVGEQLHRPYALIPRPLRVLAARADLERLPRLRRAGRALRALSIDDRAKRYTAWTETFPPGERRALLGRDVNGPEPAVAAQAPRATDVRDDVSSLMLFELRTWLVDTYLEKVDKATMATSLEARVPLLDPRLVEFMALAPRRWKIAGGRTKVLLRDVASRWLPPATIAKAKQGFGPPIGLWLRTSLRQDVEALTDASPAIARWLDRDAVRGIVLGHRRGEWRDAQIWSLLMLERWARAESAAPSV
jgi:asparagine synthase (glutamine-hydrolysing)